MQYLNGLEAQTHCKRNGRIVVLDVKVLRLHAHTGIFSLWHANLNGS